MLLAVLLSAVYGAYFGAGLGVLLLGVLGVFLAEPLRRINALKNVSSLVINTVALVAFGLFGPVAWEAVLVIAVTALAGGFLGAKIASRIPSALLRTLVVLTASWCPSCCSSRTDAGRRLGGSAARRLGGSAARPARRPAARRLGGAARPAARRLGGLRGRRLGGSAGRRARRSAASGLCPPRAA